LKCFDEEVIEVEEEVMSGSKVVMQCLQDAGGAAEEEEIPLMNQHCTAPVIGELLRWMEAHKDDPPLPTEEPELNPLPPGWTDRDPPMPGVPGGVPPIPDNWVNRMALPNTDWDKQWIEEAWNKEMLFGMMEASNYLEHQYLSDCFTRFFRDLVCATPSNKALIAMLGLTDDRGQPCRAKGEE